MDGAGGVVRSVWGQWLARKRLGASSERHGTAPRILCFLLLGLQLFAAAVARADNASSRLVTWPGWEPDKAAAAWYWVRHVNPRTEIAIVEAGATQAHGVFFDTPNATYRRTQSLSTLESVLRQFPTTDPAILTLARLTHDIEINAWRPRVHQQSVPLENAFRAFTARWQGNEPPTQCILGFFDRVHAWLGGDTSGLEKALTVCGK